MIIANENASVATATMTSELLDESIKLAKEELQVTNADENNSSPMVENAEQEDGEVSDASAAATGDEGEIVEGSEEVNLEESNHSTKRASIKTEEDVDDEKKSALEKLKNMKFRAKTKVSVGSPDERRDRERKERQPFAPARLQAPTRKDTEEDRRLRKRRWEDHNSEATYSSERAATRATDAKQRSHTREQLSPVLKQAEHQKAVSDPCTLRRRVEKFINVNDHEVVALSDSELRSTIVRMFDLEKEQFRIFNGRRKQIETLHSLFKTAKGEVDRLYALIPHRMRSGLMHLVNYSGNLQRRDEASSSGINGMTSQQLNGAMQGMPIGNRPPLPGQFGPPPHAMHSIAGMAPPTNMPPPQGMLASHTIPPPNMTLTGMSMLPGMMSFTGMGPPSSGAASGSTSSMQAGSSCPGPSSSEVRSDTNNPLSSSAQPSQDQSSNGLSAFPVAPSLLNRNHAPTFVANPPISKSPQPSSLPHAYMTIPPPSSTMSNMTSGHYVTPKGTVSASSYTPALNEGLPASSVLPNMSKPPPTFVGSAGAIPPNFSVPPPSSGASSAAVSGASLTITSTSALNVQTNLSSPHQTGSSPNRSARKSPIPTVSTLPPVNLSVPPPMFNLPPPRGAVLFSGPPPNTAIPHLNRPPPTQVATASIVSRPPPNMTLPPSMGLSGAPLGAHLSHPPPNLNFPPPNIRPTTNLTNPRPAPLNPNATVNVPPSGPLPRMTVPPPNIASMSVPPPTTGAKKLPTVDLSSGSSLGASPSSFHSFGSPSQQGVRFTNRTPSQANVNPDLRDVSRVKGIEDNSRLLTISDEEEAAK